ncbi:uncharacterized protein [Macrobrachium rosenbergii]|uniref:uncharacterized protein n=1 Tax=Macrobrachium rosenbergii TaxID=79674 RepID=UPI0034D669C2
MNDCNPKAIPCDLSINKLISSDSKELANPKLYREIVGSLIYIITGTRPALSYVVTKLSQYMSNPTLAHLSLARHVLKYLKGTLNHCLTFKKSDDPLCLVGYCDSDWGASEDRRSITGYCFKLYADVINCNRETIVLNVDNKGDIALAKNPVHHQRSKHIDIKHHFIYKISN